MLLTAKDIKAEKIFTYFETSIEISMYTGNQGNLDNLTLFLPDLVK